MPYLSGIAAAEEEIMSSPADIEFVCDPDQYAIFASVLWEVARSSAALEPMAMAPDEAVLSWAAEGPVSSAPDGWAEWATDPDWRCV